MPEFLYRVYDGNGPKLYVAEIANRGPKQVLLKESNVAFGFRRRFTRSSTAPMVSPRAAWESYMARQLRLQLLAIAEVERTGDNYRKALEEVQKLPDLVL